jgi:nicotinamidase-related amidase
MNSFSAWMTLGTLSALAALALGGAASRTRVSAPPSDAVPARTLRALYGLRPPEQLNVAHSALVLVDFQEEFFRGRLPLPEGPAAVAVAERLVSWARAAGVRVVHVRNVVARADSLLFAPGSLGSQPLPELAAAPGELVVIKALAGAFSRTDLDAQLRQRGIDTLIVAGLMTHLAVATTVNDGMVLGYHVLVVSDATATRALPGAGGFDAVDAPTLQRAALAALADRAADVVDSRALLGLSLSP